MATLERNSGPAAFGDILAGLCIDPGHYQQQQAEKAFAKRVRNSERVSSKEVKQQRKEEVGEGVAR